MVDNRITHILLNYYGTVVNIIIWVLAIIPLYKENVLIKVLTLLWDKLETIWPIILFSLPLIGIVVILYTVLQSLILIHHLMSLPCIPLDCWLLFPYIDIVPSRIYKCGLSFSSYWDSVQVSFYSLFVFNTICYII